MFCVLFAKAGKQIYAHLIKCLVMQYHCVNYNTSFSLTVSLCVPFDEMDRSIPWGSVTVFREH